MSHTRNRQLPVRLVLTMVLLLCSAITGLADDTTVIPATTNPSGFSLTPGPEIVLTPGEEIKGRNQRGRESLLEVDAAPSRATKSACDKRSASPLNFPKRSASPLKFSPLKFSEVILELRKHHSKYAKGKNCFDLLEPKTDTAIAMSRKQIAQKPSDKWPNPSTFVHLIVEELRSIAKRPCG